MVDGGGVVGWQGISMWVVRGPGIVSNAADVLGMSVVRGVKGDDGVCEMCLSRGGVGDEGVSG